MVPSSSCSCGLALALSDTRPGTSWAPVVSKVHISGSRSWCPCAWSALFHAPCLVLCLSWSLLHLLLTGGYSGDLPVASPTLLAGGKSENQGSLKFFNSVWLAPNQWQPQGSTILSREVNLLVNLQYLMFLTKQCQSKHLSAPTVSVLVIMSIYACFFFFFLSKNKIGMVQRRTIRKDAQQEAWPILFK